MKTHLLFLALVGWNAFATKECTKWKLLTSATNRPDVKRLAEALEYLPTKTMGVFVNGKAIEIQDYEIIIEPVTEEYLILQTRIPVGDPGAKTVKFKFTHFARLESLHLHGVNDVYPLGPAFLKGTPDGDGEMGGIFYTITTLPTFRVGKNTYKDVRKFMTGDHTAFIAPGMGAVRVEEGGLVQTLEPIND